MVEVIIMLVGDGVGRLGFQFVRDDMKLLGLHSEWAFFRDMWRYSNIR